MRNLVVKGAVVEVRRAGADEDLALRVIRAVPVEGERAPSRAEQRDLFSPR